MANIQIPNLPPVISLNGAELLEGVQAGSSVRISLGQIIAASATGTPASLPVPVDVGGTGATTAAAARVNLGLGTVAVQNANAVAITGGTVSGITDLAVTDGGTGASDATGARANLGLGTVAVQNANAVAITGGTINGTSIGGATASTGAFTTGTFGLGAVGTPSITFSGDTNTGIWSPSADNVAISTGGLERMRIDATGAVGVGGAAPASAAFSVTSTSGGFLFPRMTTVQRDAIASPANGLMIYNTTNARFELRANSIWMPAVLYFDTVTALLANTSMTYPSTPTGATIEAGGFRYAVAAVAATDQHVTTAGGVKLYVQAGASGYSVKAFGAVGDGVTDDTSAFNAFFALIRTKAKFGQITPPNIVEDGEVSGVIEAARYLCAGSVDATRIRGVGWTILADGAEIYSKATGKAALDLLGTRWGTIRGLKIAGDATNRPRTGFQYGRIVNGTYSCDGMAFDRCKTDGYFTVAGVFNLASETDSHVNPIYFNGFDDPNSFCMMFDGDNSIGATSDFVAASLLSGVARMSNVQHSIFGGEIRKFNGGPAIGFMATAKQVKFYNSYAVSTDDAIVVFSQDDGASAGFADIHLDIHCETGGLQYCVRFTQHVASTKYFQFLAFTFIDHAPFAADSIFKIESAVSRVIMMNARIIIPQFITAPTNKLTAETSKLYVLGDVHLSPTLYNDFNLNGRLFVDASVSIGTRPVGSYEIIDQNRKVLNAPLPAYTTSTLPTATGVNLIFVSNESGGSVPAFWDGANWRRVTDRAIVS